MDERTDRDSDAVAAPPRRASVSSAPPRRASVSSAPPQWASVSSAPPRLNVFGHDGDPLGVDGTQVSVLKQTK